MREKIPLEITKAIVADIASTRVALQVLAAGHPHGAAALEHSRSLHRALVAAVPQEYADSVAGDALLTLEMIHQAAEADRLRA